MGTPVGLTTAAARTSRSIRFLQDGRPRPFAPPMVQESPMTGLRHDELGDHLRV